MPVETFLESRPDRSGCCSRAGLVLLGLLASSYFADPASAQVACFVASGRPRAAILDALREPVSKDLHTKIEFVVKRVRICSGWAFVIATPQKPGGGSIRWAGTPCQGDTSHLVGALLRERGDGWTLVDYALCPSDVAWEDWPERHRAPAALFEE